jgi:hypothetical protein
MAQQYTEQDTERARVAEHSSAGLHTQQLQAQPYRNERNTQIAWVLLILGAFMLFARLSGGLADGIGSVFLPLHLNIEGGVFFSIIASVFLFFAFWKRIYGLLIPGSILGGFALGVTFADFLGGAPFFWGLSMGFFGLLCIGQLLFQVRHIWPAIPGVILLALGTLVAATQLPAILGSFALIVPALLIAAGLYLGWARKTR